MTDYKGLIEGARSYVYPKQLDYDVIHTLADALEATLVRLEAAELRLTKADRALLYANQHMRPRTDWAVGSKWDELLEKAWREAKSS